MIMVVTLKKAGLKDVNSIKEIIVESRNEYLPYAPISYNDKEMVRWIKETLLPKSNVWLAITNEQAIGVCASSDRGIDTWIDQLYIKPGFLKRGAGSSLLNEAISNSKFTHIKTACFELNTHATAFYLNRGFKVKFTRDASSNEQGLPDIILEKKVS